MFAVVANGIATTCKTQRELDRILTFYPKATFAKVKTKEDAYVWLSQNKRSINEITRNRCGNTSKGGGYVEMEYFIEDNTIYCNVSTDKVGKVKILPDNDVEVSYCSNLIKIKVNNVVLNNMLIAHHCLAINRLLKIIGEFIDVDVLVPDMSIFLAVTKYSGKNYIIRNLQSYIQRRLGGFSVTVKG